MYQTTIVVGHLGKDPEMRYTSSGVPVTSFSIATTRKWTSQDGTPGEKTTWFKVTAWRKLAETCNQYLSKGRLVLVEGEIGASAWVPRDGGDPRATLELTARNVKFLGRREPAAGEAEGPPADMAADDIPF